MSKTESKTEVAKDQDDTTPEKLKTRDYDREMRKLHVELV